MICFSNNLLSLSMLNTLCIIHKNFKISHHRQSHIILIHHWFQFFVHKTKELLNNFQIHVSKILDCMLPAELLRKMQNMILSKRNFQSFILSTGRGVFSVNSYLPFNDTQIKCKLAFTISLAHLDHIFIHGFRRQILLLWSSINYLDECMYRRTHAQITQNILNSQKFGTATH